MARVHGTNLTLPSKTHHRRAVSGLLLCGILGFGVQVPAQGDAASDRAQLAKSLAASPLSESQKVVHLLNRLGFGPRPADLEKVRSMGIGDYISSQLHPERIDDSALERRLEGLETIHQSSRELAMRLSAAREAGRTAQPRKQPDGAKPESTTGSDPSSDQQKQREGVRQIGVQLQQAKILRAVYSERQLQEVMTDFWFNHFNVFIGKGADRIFTTEYEREVIRPNSLGKFHDLLAATAKSPAMLFYLDNWMSVDPNSQQLERAMRLRRRGVAPADEPQPRRRPRGLNENYARELMELHTLGVDGGYSQKDVTEVARCFTGWTLRNPRQGGSFQFVGLLHDPGGKTVLGQKIPANGGSRDGEIVLQMLSRHPSTAHFIATKLCRRFVSDAPPESLVKRAAATFLNTDGDIRQVLGTIFAAPEFWSNEAYRAKTKKPLELVASALRATQAETAVPPKILLSLRAMGESLYGCQPPTGYPDTAEAWINSGALLERMNFATELAGGRIPRTRMRLELAFAGDEASRSVSRLARTLLHEEPSKGLVEAVAKQLEPTPGEKPGEPRTIATIAGLILGSPEFQKR